MASGVISKLLLGILVLSFAVWGVGDIFRNTGSQTTVATVGDESISDQELAQLIGRIQQTFGQITPEVAADPQFRLQALNNLIDNRLLELEAKKTGIHYDRSTLAAYIARNPMFQKADGTFNRELFQATLQQNGWSEQDYLARLQDDLATAMLRDTVSAGVEVSDSLVKTYYAVREEQREASLILISEKDIGTVAEPTDADLDALYKDQPERFTKPEYRSFEYVSFEPDTAWKTLKLDPSEDVLKGMFETRKSELKVPEKRKIDQLLIEDEAAAKEISQKIKGGLSFDDAAKLDKVANGNRVAVGTLPASGLPATAAEPVFKLEKNAVSEPIQTDFGWHIFRVTDIIPAHDQTFDEAKPTLMTDYKAEHMEEEISQLANTLEDALAGGASMQDALKQANLDSLHISSLGPIAKNGMQPDNQPLELSPLQQEALQTAFTLDKGQTSQLLMTQKGSYYLARMKDIIPSQLQVKEEVTDQLKELYRQRTIRDAVRDKASEIAELLKQSDNPNAAARDLGLSLQTSGKIGRMNDTVSNNSELKDKILTSGFVQELFRLRTHEVSGAYPLPSGEYIIGILEGVHAAPEPDETDLLTLKDELKGQFSNDVMAQYLSYLRDKYEVDIKTALFQPQFKTAGE